MVNVEAKIKTLSEEKREILKKFDGLNKLLKERTIDLDRYREMQATYNERVMEIIKETRKLIETTKV